MVKTITTGWLEESEFFSRQRRDKDLEIIEKKWSEGSSPIMLVRAGYSEREEYEKCFWYAYPSSARCFECDHAKVCDKYTP